MLVYIIDICNYKCKYCFNSYPSTNLVLDLEKVYYFITQILIKKLHKEYIQLDLIGGEPTLHPNLIEFCKKISKIDNIYTTIFTNFSKPTDFYQNLISIDNRINFILSWHSLNTQYLQKLNLFSKTELENNIIIADIYEHENIKKSLEVFDYIHNTYPYIKGLNFPLIENTQTYHMTYTENDMNEYNKRLNLVRDPMKIKIQYNDQTYDIVNEHYFITNIDNRCFKHWLCYVGIDYCYIYFNGDIYPCAGYKNIKLNNIYSTKIDDFKLNEKPIFCNNIQCQCVFDVNKKNFFVKKL